MRNVFLAVIIILMGGVATEVYAVSPEALLSEQCLWIESEEADALPSILTFTEHPERRGCCSWHSGVCRCSGGRVTCCDGTTSPSCTCRGDARAYSPRLL